MIYRCQGKRRFPNAMNWMPHGFYGPERGELIDGSGPLGDRGIESWLAEDRSSAR
jgi:hypothetical protein